MATRTPHHVLTLCGPVHICGVTFKVGEATPFVSVYLRKTGRKGRGRKLQTLQLSNLFHQDSILYGWSDLLEHGRKLRKGEELVFWSSDPECRPSFGSVAVFSEPREVPSDGQ